MPHFIGTPYKKHTQFEGYDAIVIGSGIGGLMTAVLLGKYGGQRVLVLERHYTAGGFTHTFTRPGYEWDVGVHYIGQVLHTETLMSRLFHVLTDGRIRWASLGDVYDRSVIGDRIFDFPAGRENLRAALHAAFPDETASIDGYFDAVKAAVSASQMFFAAKAMPTLAGKVVSPLTRGFYKYADRSTYDVLASLGTSPSLLATLTTQHGDYGLPPKQSSFAMHALLANHYFEGAAYPIGGASVMANHAVRVIEASGGAVLVRAEVERILLRDGTAIGVRLTNGHEIFAPRVISDAGFVPTFTRMLPPDAPGRAQAEEAIRRVGISMAHLCLYVGVRGSAEELGLPRFNYWIYPDEHHDENLRRYLANVESPFPLLFISFPSARDPDFENRHPGRATIEVVTAANWDWFQRWVGTSWKRRGQEYEDLKARLSERLLHALYQVVPQIRGRVEIAELSTPLSTVEFTGHPRGAIYGLAHTPARFREPMLRPVTPIRHLYLTGADVSTAGVGGAMVGGVLTASAILRRNMIKAVIGG